MINVGSASQLVFTTEPVGNVTEGTNFTTSPVVKVEDASGNVVNDTGSVTLAVSSGPGAGTLACSNTGFPTISAVAGVATFTNCQITGTAAAGTYVLSASRSGLTGPFTSSNVVINVGSANQLVFTTEPVGNVTEGTNFTTSPVVKVEDASGNVVNDTGSVTLAVSSGPGAGTLACSNTGFPTISAVAGVATFTNCQITGTAAAGTYTLKATRTGLTPTGASSNVVINVGSASQLVFGQQPSNAYVGVSMSPAVNVLIEDQNGNQTSDTSTIALTITTNPCGGSPVVTNGTVNAVSGSATFSSLQISKECIGYALTATDALITLVSNTFTVSSLVTSSANVLQDAATDSGGSGMNSVTYYYCSGFTTSCSPSTPGTIGSSTTSPNFQFNWTSLPTNGNYSLVAVGTDNTTNSTASTPPIPVTVDGNGPTGGIISVPKYTNTLSVTITTTNFTDSASGMASNVITRSNGQAPVSGVCPTGVYTGATPVASPDTGVTNGNCYEYTLTGTANDGTSASVTSSPVLVDTVAPVTTITLSPSSPNGTGGWYKGTSPTFTLSATDTGGSGVATTYYEIDGGTQTVYPGSAVAIPDGSAQTISYWSVDNAGNTETTHTSSPLKVDTVAPVTTITLSPSSPNGTGGWYKGTSPTFTLSATDTGGSGVATTYYEIDGGTQTVYPGSAVAIPDGSAQTISYWSVDNAGNTETTHTSSPLKVDTVAPVTTITLSPSSPNGTGGWYKGTSPTFTLSATDTGGSGVATTYYEIDGGTQTVYPGSAVAIPDGSAQTISYWSVDNAGNTETTHTSSPLKVDTVAPVTTITLSPSSPNGTGGWYKGTSPTFTLSATDTGGSGVATTYYEIDGGTQTVYPGSAVAIPDGSAQTISYWSVDNAGNTETTHTSSPLKVDTTVPSGGAVTVNSAAATSGGSTSTTTSTSFAINSRADYTDSGSGLASSTLTVQSETLTGTTCGAPGSGGPFTSPTTVTGTTQPSGITKGYCYLYTLTGTDNAGNTASISTTVTVTSSIHLDGSCSQLNITTNTSTAEASCSAAAADDVTSLSIKAPSTLVTGDVLIAQVTVHDVASAAITNSNWTQIRSDTTGSLTQDEFYHVVGSSEPSSWTFSWTQGAADATGGILEFAGVSTSTPVDLSADTTGSTGTGSNWMMTAPSVTTVHANDEVIAFYGTGGSQTFNADTYSGEDGAAMQYSAVSNETTNTCGNGTTSACESDAAAEPTASVQTGAGATGTFTLTQSQASNAGYAWIAATVALEP